MVPVWKLHERLKGWKQNIRKYHLKPPTGWSSKPLYTVPKGMPGRVANAYPQWNRVPTWSAQWNAEYEGSFWGMIYKNNEVDPNGTLCAKSPLRIEGSKGHSSHFHAFSIHFHPLRACTMAPNKWDIQHLPVVQLEHKDQPRSPLIEHVAFAGANL